MTYVHKYLYVTLTDKYSEMRVNLNARDSVPRTEQIVSRLIYGP